uniref:Uncharacterized protein n=1 Tax=Ditylenchus dipsaci TaxID=166011 RepID=A0A915EAR1_9BILA
MSISSNPPSNQSRGNNSSSSTQQYSQPPVSYAPPPQYNRSMPTGQQVVLRSVSPSNSSTNAPVAVGGPQVRMLAASGHNYAQAPASMATALNNTKTCNIRVLELLEHNQIEWLAMWSNKVMAHPTLVLLVDNNKLLEVVELMNKGLEITTLLEVLEELHRATGQAVAHLLIQLPAMVLAYGASNRPDFATPRTGSRILFSRCF